MIEDEKQREYTVRGGPRGGRKVSSDASPGSEGTGMDGADQVQHFNPRIFDFFCQVSWKVGASWRAVEVAG
jgi:hypothetical protein